MRDYSVESERERTRRAAAAWMLRQQGFTFRQVGELVGRLDGTGPITVTIAAQLVRRYERVLRDRQRHLRLGSLRATAPAWLKRLRAAGALIVIALLVGCVDVPKLGTVWECEAVFYCDGQPFDITPSHGCARDEVEALDRYQDSLDELTAEARCATRSFTPACEDTRERCSY